MKPPWPESEGSAIEDHDQQMTSRTSTRTFTVPTWEGWHGLSTRTKALLPRVATVLKKEGDFEQWL